MYGCLIVPPVTFNADFGVLFTHNEGYSTMCGHGIIAVVTVAVELGLVPPSEGETRVGIDTPAGFIEARALVAGGRVEAVSFVNVPSFVTATDQVIDVPDVGRVNYDLAFGGAFYAFVEAGQVGLGLGPADYRRLIEVGRSIKSAIQSEGEPTHPVDPDLGLLYGTIFVGPPSDPRNHSRNVCVFADGEVDRSPTGTGVSARLALHHARGDLKAEEIVVESILGTTFRGRIAEETTVGGFTAVIPEVTGSAYITGRNEVFLDPDDPLVEGFFLR
jgi:trans-L-3-hydroxyproline dehydratase